MTEITKGKIAKQDIEVWDGMGAKTFARRTIAGGTETLDKIDWVGIDVLATYGDGTSYTAATLNAAIDAVGSTACRFFLTAGDWTVSSNVTIPSNVTLYFMDGAVITLSDGATFTVDGRVDAHVEQHIFTCGGGAGDVEGLPFASVKWFGALGKTTEDTAECQAAITAVNTHNYGGTVFFPPGNYKVSDTLVSSGHYTMIEGDSRGNTYITRDDSFTSGNTISISKGGGATPIYYGGIKNLYIRATTAMTSGAHLHLQVYRQFVVENCILSEGYYGIHAISCGQFRMANLTITTGSLYPTGGSEAGAYVLFDTDHDAPIPRNGGYVDNCNFRSQNDLDPHVLKGIYITSADGIWFDQVHVGQTADASVYCSPKSGTAQLSGLCFENCWFDNCGGYGMHFTGSTSAAYTHHSIYDCYFTAANNGTTAIRAGLASGELGNLLIKDCFIVNWNQGGIILTDCENFTIDGCQVREVGNDSGHGVAIYGSSKNYTIQNNAIGFKTNGTTTQGAGYGLVLSGSGYLVTGNDLRGNTTGAIYDSSLSGEGLIRDNLVEERDIDVASAATITLPLGSDYIVVSGTTNISTITASWQTRQITLRFGGVLTLADGSNLKLAGDFVTTVNDTITLVCDGTDWYEVSRSAN